VFLTHALSAKEEAEFNASHAYDEQRETHAGQERDAGYPAHQAARQKSGINDGKHDGKRPSANACDVESSSHHADHAWGESGASGHSRSQ